jgi:hypothetical protein
LAERQLLVYVQALPSSIGLVKKFKDLEDAEFRLSHSSKVALSFASSLGFHEILAAGFAPVSNEAVARGATSVFSLPLCDEPARQAEFFPKEEFTHIIIGESLDWVFSGASLVGVLAHKYNLKAYIAAKETKYPERSLILVKDPGAAPEAIDVRRIKGAMEVKLDVKDVQGEVSFQTLEPVRTEMISGESAEIASSLSRKIRRFVKN